MHAYPCLRAVVSRQNTRLISSDATSATSHFIVLCNITYDGGNHASLMLLPLTTVFARNHLAVDIGGDQLGLFDEKRAAGFFTGEYQHRHRRGVFPIRHPARRARSCDEYRIPSRLGSQIEHKNFSAFDTFHLQHAFLIDRGAIACAQHCSIQSHTSARDLQPSGPAGL